MIRKHQHPNSPVQVGIWDLYLYPTLEAVYCSWWNGSVWGVEHHPYGHSALLLPTKLAWNGLDILDLLVLLYRQESPSGVERLRLVCPTEDLGHCSNP